MSGKVALITGANKGIGLETARQLARKGIHVILGSRDAARGAAAAQKLQKEGLPAESLKLDVTSAQDIAAAVGEVERKHGKLDILVNNAGVFCEEFGKKPSEQTLDAWRKSFETNLFAVVALTQAFLPLLKKAPAARIVNVSSQLGSLGWHSDPNSPIYHFKVPAYSASKAALTAWTVQLAYEFKDTPVKVNAVHPGYVKTDMGGAGATMEVEDGARTSVEMATLGADGPTGGFFHLGERLPW
ncbi:MAG: SDR family oxidoreductase [Nevskia sp.]|nr:SDR family oxidoreductase [Nevskia sp.]